jgi:DNA processing protein
MPAALFIEGDPACLSRPQVAIVGSRAATAAGRETAFDFASRLAARGFAITSGLAAGIDAAAHRGALAAGGVTVAVCGTGLDRVYPAEHRELAASIAERGALRQRVRDRNAARCLQLSAPQPASCPASPAACS